MNEPTQDIVSAVDQAEKSAEHTARIIAGFHRGLTKGTDMSEATARPITALYALKVLGLQKKGDS